MQRHRECDFNHHVVWGTKFGEHDPLVENREHDPPPMDNGDAARPCKLSNTNWPTCHLKPLFKVRLPEGRRTTRALISVETGLHHVIMLQYQFIIVQAEQNRRKCQAHSNKNNVNVQSKT